MVLPRIFKSSFHLSSYRPELPPHTLLFIYFLRKTLKFSEITWVDKSNQTSLAQNEKNCIFRLNTKYKQQTKMEQKE